MNTRDVSEGAWNEARRLCSRVCVLYGTHHTQPRTHEVLLLAFAGIRLGHVRTCTVHGKRRAPTYFRLS